jgi:hypothetical protein
MATAKRVAMQQARAKEALEAQIAELRSRVADLEAILAQLQRVAEKPGPAARKSK